MPRATVASRELKNKDTGLDLFVPTFKEVKGRLSSTVYYQVVIVTSLPFFKTPSHKESDVVQCSCEKKWSEFEDLRVKLTETFAGTVLPALDKKSFILNDQVIKERRNTLEAFLKFVASKPKLAVSASVLQFLGVDAVRAKKAKQTDAKKAASSGNDGEEGGEEDKSEQDPDQDVFGEEQDAQEEGGLFDDIDNDDAQGFGFEDEHTETSTASISMFEAQDMKADISEEDEKNFNFIPDAIITKREKVPTSLLGEEDNSELFRIQDDLDQLMVVDVKAPGRERSKQESTGMEQTPPTTSITEESKPKPGVKPSIPTKPKPAVSAKPTIPPKKSASATAGSVPYAVTSSIQDGGQSASAIDVMQQDDLLDYLQKNLTSDADDVDLFS